MIDFNQPLLHDTIYKQKKHKLYNAQKYVRLRDTNLGYDHWCAYILYLDAVVLTQCWGVVFFPTNTFYSMFSD